MDRRIISGFIRVPVPGFRLRQSVMQFVAPKRKQLTRDELQALFARELDDLKKSGGTLRPH
jgi:hypothetical protein